MASSVRFLRKGHTKALAAFLSISAIYCPIWLKFCLYVPYWPLLAFCFVAFEIKGHEDAKQRAILTPYRTPMAARPGTDFRAKFIENILLGIVRFVIFSFLLAITTKQFP